jgi:DNA-binding NtrC family response regulator
MSDLHRESSLCLAHECENNATMATPPTLEPEPIHQAPRVLALVDDDPVFRRLLRAWLEAEGFEVREFPTGEAALQAPLGNLSGALLDLGLGDVPGLDVLRRWKTTDPEFPVLVITARSGVTSVVEAMRAGAYDYLSKPLERERLLVSLRNAIERATLVRKVWALSQAATSPSSVVGQSLASRQLQAHIQRVLHSDVAVCILGESGTGKELVARAIHQQGHRSKGPFVAVNCGAIPENLIEAELFGYEKGAFTGASSLHRGRFEEASGGTLFLDEIGDMPLAAQVRLLRALQEKSIRRLGGTAEVKLNTRVIAATHHHLEAEIKAGRFREDLYFRLMVYPIETPPLRERIEDIPALVAHFLHILQGDVGRPLGRIAPEALAALADHPWPGNIRELQNVIHRAMLSCSSDRIEVSDLPPTLQRRAPPPAPAPPTAPPEAGRLPTLVLRDLEALAIEEALARAAGHVGNAARLLGLGRATLYRRLVDLGKKSDPGEEPPR